MNHAKLSSLVCAVGMLVSVFDSCGTVSANEISFRVTQEQIIVLPSSNGQEFQVVEVQKVENLGEKSAQYRFSVPRSAVNIKVGGVSVARDVTNGPNHLVTWNKPILSHETQTVTSSFTLALDGSKGIQFDLYSECPIDSAYVYLPEGKTSLSAEGLLASTQTQVIAGTTFRVFSRLGIAAGDDWEFSLDTLPSTTTSPLNENLPVIGNEVDGEGSSVDALLNLSLVAFVLVIGLLGIRSTSFKRSRFQTRTERLFEMLKKLEVDNAAEPLDKASYEARRLEIKEAIITRTLEEEARSRNRQTFKGETC